MIRLTSVLFSLALFSSCSNLTYSPEKNCSKRGLDHLKEKISTNESDKKYYDSKISEIKEFYLKNSPEFQKCYQEYLNESIVNRDEYAVCTIVTITNGKMTFLDIDDRENSLKDNLRQCLVGKFNALDWTFISRKTPVTITQPFNLRATRN